MISNAAVNTTFMKTKITPMTPVTIPCYLSVLITKSPHLGMSAYRLAKNRCKDKKKNGVQKVDGRD